MKKTVIMSTSVTTDRNKVIKVSMDKWAFAEIDSGELTIEEIESLRLSKQIIEQTVNGVFLPKIFKQLKRIEFKESFKNIKGLYISSCRSVFSIKLLTEDSNCEREFMRYYVENKRLEFNSSAIDYLTVNTEALKQLEKLLHELKKFVRELGRMSE